MSRGLLRSILTLTFVAATASCRVTPSEPTLEPGRYERASRAEFAGAPLRYVLDVPEPSTLEPNGWPLMLFLHGAGERGQDLASVSVHGPPKLMGQIPELERFVVVSPQCPNDVWWQSAPLLELLDEVAELLPVDPNRVHVTGISMGGYGTWNLLSRAPDRFASVVAVCGGGDPGRLWPEVDTGFELERLLRATNVPIRAYHGALDAIVPPRESQVLVDALRAAGADVELTVYEGVEHDSWSQTYANPELYRWMLGLRR